MALIDKLHAIASGFRNSRGIAKELSLDEMAVLAAEPLGSNPVIQSLEVTENGTFSAPDGVDGYSPVTVNVAASGGSSELFQSFIQGEGELEITDSNFPGLTKIQDQCFYGCENVKKLHHSTVQSLGNEAFRQTYIEEVYAPNVKTIGSNTFRFCKYLLTFYLPEMGKVQTSAFEQCTSLKKADLLKVNQLERWAFGTCSVLEALIIRTEIVATMVNVDALEATPIAKGTGYIYVPAALVESYKTATNWAVYADQIRAIEDYPEICGEVSE